MSTTVAARETGVPPASLATVVEGTRQGVQPALLIQPSSGWPVINVAELWQHRGLYLFLVWRDLKVRYAQTVLGAGWAVLQPLFHAIVFTVVFGRLAGVPSDGAPYTVFALAALAPWMYFTQVLTVSSGSLVANTHLLTKIYFPRLLIPLTPVLVALVDFVVAFAILLLLLAAFGITPLAWAWLLVPVLTVIIMLTGAGTGAWLAALNLQYRDIRAIITVVVQGWMYASPVIYPLSLVPEKYRTIYMLNPMVGIVEGFRAVLLGTQDIPWTAIGISAAIGSVLFYSGARYFRHVEQSFADIA